jgi:hypothetical protein
MQIEIQAPIGRLFHFNNLQKWGVKLVMPGLVPDIHVLATSKQEGRGWPGRARP